MKDILTTFEIAKLCGVDITTVINWIDSGKLTAYKTPGGHRRVRRDEFLKFLRAYQLPIPRGFGGNGYTLLVVDDDSELREFIAETIKSKWPEITIWEAEDGFTAGKLLAEKLPSLVILDMRLPGIDGLQVCTLIRSDRRLKHTRVLAITAYHSPAAQQRAMKAGVDDYMAKPFSGEDFIARVERLIGGAGVAL